MQISFLTPHLEIRGANRRIIELSNGLMRKGHRVTIFHSDGSECKWMNCSAKIKSLADVTSLSHDVLIDTNRKHYPFIYRAKAKLKIFYVLLLYGNEKDYLNGFHPTLILPYNKLFRWFRKILKDQAIVKLSNSSGIKSELDKLGVKSTLLLGGVNFKMFHPMRRKQSFSFKILATGDPLGWKGSDTVYQAIMIAQRTEPRLKLESYYGKNIPQDKMAKKYGEADIFVDAQIRGGWNNPVAEAMACKVPVVCTDIGSVKDFAFHEKTALLAAPGAPKALAIEILKLVRDESLRNRLRNNAYKMIRQFTWKKSVQRLEKILDKYL